MSQRVVDNRIRAARSVPRLTGGHFASLAGPETPAEGADLGLERYRGKILVLNFWATWCAPCRTEIPLLVAVQRDYGPRGVQVVGPSIDEPQDRESAERFARDMRVNYPVLQATPPRT